MPTAQVERCIDGLLWSFGISFKEGSVTAIGVSGSQEGFIIGADGRKSVDHASLAANPTLATHSSDKVQKVFPIIGQDRIIAYAIAGYAIAHEPDPTFDGIKECAALLGRARAYNYENALRLVNQFSHGLTAAVNKAKHYPELKKTPNGDWTIMDVIFAGYFRGVPFLIHVNFYHADRFAEFHSQPMSLSGILYGSEVVRKVMYDDFGDTVTTSPFSQYIQNPRTIQSLDDSERYVKGYIEACSTELALTMDEPICKTIGGHIHIAEITHSAFKWRISPLTE